ncbi:hypothetical protein [Nocardia sp. NPDC052566]|uniref:hypothetical protein n=1 Tax=Nocardia sp. NPDC052566 TaxID=3364330 RepID=UPI0037CBA32B
MQLTEPRRRTIGEVVREPAFRNFSQDEDAMSFTHALAAVLGLCLFTFLLAMVVSMHVRGRPAAYQWAVWRRVNQVVGAIMLGAVVWIWAPLSTTVALAGLAAAVVGWIVVGWREPRTVANADLIDKLREVAGTIPRHETREWRDHLHGKTVQMTTDAAGTRVWLLDDQDAVAMACGHIHHQVEVILTLSSVNPVPTRKIWVADLAPDSMRKRTKGPRWGHRIHRELCKPSRDDLREVLDVIDISDARASN